MLLLRPCVFLIRVLRGSPQHCVLRSSLQHYVCMFVSYEALSGTMFVSYGALSGTISDCDVFVSYGALSSTKPRFVSYEALSGTISDCGVTSGALSGTYASTTGLQNLMESMLGHE